MIWLLVTLCWVFVGLLSIGIERRIENKKMKKSEVLWFLLFGPIIIWFCIYAIIEWSDWWNEKI